MSVKRRLAAAGMPAVGVTVFAALALTGLPAGAAVVDGSALARSVAVAPATCDPDSRVKCGYGDADDDGSAGGATADPADGSGSGDGVDGSGSGDPADGSGSGDGVADDDRGGDGYGGQTTPPTTAPTPTSPATTATPVTTAPGGGTDEVPGGEAPATVSPSDEDILPVTGPPVGVITTVGALLAAGGAAVLLGLRRRRNG